MFEIEQIGTEDMIWAGSIDVVLWEYPIEYWLSNETKFIEIEALKHSSIKSTSKSNEAVLSCPVWDAHSFRLYRPASAVFDAQIEKFQSKDGFEDPASNPKTLLVIS